MSSVGLFAYGSAGGTEVAVLERFARQRHAPGAMPARLLDRFRRRRQPTATGPNNDPDGGA